MSDITLTLVILVVAVVVFVWNRLPVGIVALGVALGLYGVGVLTLEQSLAGFGNPTVILIAALFVVAEGLDAAGITAWAGQQLVRRAGTGRGRLIIATMGVAAVMSALITPNGSVAALAPMVVVLAVRLGRSPSQLLMPLAFAAHAGSLLVLTGSPVNLLVSQAADAAGAGPIGFFEHALVGVPLLAGTIAIVVVLGQRLIPARRARSLPRDLADHPRRLLRDYLGPEPLVRLVLGVDSDLIGRSAAETDARTDHLTLVSQHNAKGAPSNDPLAAGHALVARGGAADVQRFAAAHALTVVEDTGRDGRPAAHGLLTHEFGVAEVVVAPRSGLIGTSVFPGMVTESGALVVLAVQRGGESLDAGTEHVVAGDSLLLHGTWDALDEHTDDPHVIVVDSPDAVRRQAAPLGPTAVPALVVVAVMMVLLTTGLVPATVACLLAAVAMVLLRVVTVDQAYRAVSWTTIVLVAAMIPLSTAITQTGAADMIAEGFVDLVGDGHPLVLLAGLFLITAVLGQLISNTATALILIPIGVSVAAESGLAVMPVLMCINVAAAAALLTPVATPANMMVMAPAGYRFGDYARLGLPVLGLYMVVGVFLVPVIWSF
ncbi:SLC13 family permease [Cellulomonas hominis]